MSYKSSVTSRPGDRLSQLFGGNETPNDTNIFTAISNTVKSFIPSVPTSDIPISSDLGLTSIKSEDNAQIQTLENMRERESALVQQLNSLRAEEAKLETQYNNSKHTVYHVVVDSVCSLNLRSIKPYTHGNMRAYNKQANRIPVTLSLDDAKLIAEKIAKEIDARGGSSTNAYPIFGTIILQIEIEGVHLHHANVYTGGAKRDYNLLNDHLNEQNQFVVYNAGNVQRGMLHENALANAKLVAIKYEIAFRPDEHLGFALLNSLKLNNKDLQEMKKAYAAGLNGEMHMLQPHVAPVATYVPQTQPQSLSRGLGSRPQATINGSKLLSSNHSAMEEQQRSSRQQSKSLENLFSLSTGQTVESQLSRPLSRPLSKPQTDIQQNSFYSSVVPALPEENQTQPLEGGFIDYKKLYLEEKATYLKLKALKNKQH
jgi:hypothetical protein